jgi:aquaporin Z
VSRLLAELLGAFFLVLAGTGAIVVNQATAGSITHVGVALVFGLVVMSLIYAFGDISGAHFNPAVTLAFAAGGRFSARRVPGYVGAQLAGALAASLLLRLMFPADATLGATIPVGPPWRSLLLEGVLTLFLMLVILGVATGAKEKGLMAGVAIGGTIALEALFAGPISGASMNPARSLAPAIVSGHIEHLGVYLAGPLAGALAAVPIHAVLTSAQRPRGESPRGLA